MYQKYIYIYTLYTIYDIPHRYADRIILNKIDTVNEEEQKWCRKTIKDISNTAMVLESKNSIVEIKDIFNIHSLHLPIKSEDLQQCQSSPAVSDTIYNKNIEIDNVNVIYKCNSDNDNNILNDHGIFTVVLQYTTNLSKGQNYHKFCTWLDKLLFEENVNESTKYKIFRIKGVVCLQNIKEKQYIQGVYEVFTIEPYALNDTEYICWADPINCTNRIIFIGAYLDPITLARNFRNCFADRVGDL